MTTPIKLANKAMEYYRNEIDKVRKDPGLNNEGKISRLSRISTDLDEQLKKWKAETSTGIEQIERDLAEKKPVAESRKFDSDTVAVLNYQAKIIQSKIAAEGSDQQGFKDVLADIVDNGDKTTRLAFIDSFQDLTNLTKQFEHGREDVLFDYYHRARNLMKTPEQIEYEEAMSEATSQQISFSTQLMAVERNVSELKASFSSEIFGTEQKEKTIWD